MPELLNAICIYMLLIQQYPDRFQIKLNNIIISDIIVNMNAAVIAYWVVH